MSKASANPLGLSSRSPLLKIAALGITPEALEAAATRETRIWARRRLTAVAFVLRGGSPTQVAAALHTSGDCVRNWLSLTAEYGWQCFQYPRPSQRVESLPMKQAEAFRADTRAQMNKYLGPMERRRLEILLAVLEGEAVDGAAARTGVAPGTIRVWIRKLKTRGVPALLDRVYVKTPVLRADSAVLRAMAAREKHPRPAKAFAAMAHLAEGRSIHDAAYRVGVAHETVKSWLAIFRREGAEGLRKNRQGRTPRLAPGQLAELARILGHQLDIAFPELDALVRKRFGIRYSRNGLMRLVRSTLGFAQYTGKAQRSASAAL